MNSKIELCLQNVKKPARYTGGEYNSITKTDADTKIALCFPEIYEIGMSHLGSKILYGLLNEIEGVWCQRAYAPYVDMEAEMRRHGVQTYALESGDSIADFDILGFTLQYELNYTAILNMLDMARIAVRSKDRHDLSPLVVAGGPCVYNCEPVADFLDIVMIGEGEEVFPELVELYRKSREIGDSKEDFLKKAARIGGVYVPSLYEIKYNSDGTVAKIEPLYGAPEKVTKRVIADFDKAYFPDKFLVPSTEIVFDRSMVELFRGCRRGCRFCQAGYTYRPIRAKQPQTLEKQALALVNSTGYDEVSLTSLSSSDYPHLGQLCESLVAELEPRRVSLALPSLRADSFDLNLMENVQKVRKTGLTFAPEAGTQRLRDVINKNLTVEDLLSACKIAFEAGYNGIKLYFMMGLPTETDEDLEGIAKIARDVLYTFKQYAKNKQRGVRISLGVSTFVPKAQTPFQWIGQTEEAEVMRRQKLLMEKLKIKNVTFNLHKYKTSFLEAALARGDRRLSDVIEKAWRHGCNLDGWDECFKYDMWMQAFEECGLDPHFYANRAIEKDELLPWEHILSGVTKEYLYKEYLRSLEGQATPDCKAQCGNCGALSLTGGKCYV